MIMLAHLIIGRLLINTTWVSETNKKNIQMDSILCLFLNYIFNFYEFIKKKYIFIRKVNITGRRPLFIIVINRCKRG